jgi:CMP-N-acetylneuraminic acid synthetase
LKIVSITLARGGSQEVPRKNIKSLNGKPLIYYVLSSIKSAGINERWVSTDDQEIADISNSFGANILMRPPEMALNTSKCEEALRHFSNNVDFDVMAFVQTTSPMIKPDYIKQGIEMMRSGYDSVFTAYKEHWAPRWSLEVDPIGWETHKRPRRQQVRENYVENGSFYMTTREAFKKTGVRYSGKIGVVEMPFSESFQVDSYDDFSLIERLMK